MRVLFIANEEMEMKANRILMVALASACAAGWTVSAQASGKDKFAADCGECHEAADFEGEDAKALEASITKIVNGEQKHKSKLKLNAVEIKELADYMATGGK
jgi:mono/diheme cytochrome c family protein